MTGALMARAGLDRRGTLPLAATTLVVAANAPDIDIFVMFLGSYASLAFRRGWTHGPVALVVLPLAITALILTWDRLVRRRSTDAHSRAPVDARATLLIAAIGVASHPALDWLNTYGIRLLMPFSRDWFYGDSLFIIDPWLWLLLACALVPRRRTLRRIQIFGALAAAYLLTMITLSRVAEPIARRAAENAGISGIAEVMYQPEPGQPHRGSLIVVTRDAYMPGSFRWLATGANRVALLPNAIPRGDWTDTEVREAMTDPRVRDFLAWSRYPFVRTESTPDGIAVLFGDARFTDGRAGALQGVRVPPRTLSGLRAVP